MKNGLYAWMPAGRSKLEYWHRRNGFEQGYCVALLQWAPFTQKHFNFELWNLNSLRVINEIDANRRWEKGRRQGWVSISRGPEGHESRVIRRKREPLLVLTQHPKSLVPVIITTFHPILNSQRSWGTLKTLISLWILERNRFWFMSFLKKSSVSASHSKSIRTLRDRSGRGCSESVHKGLEVRNAETKHWGGWKS